MGEVNAGRCAVSDSLQVIGGKWKCIIVFHLLSDTRRFSELKRAMAGISQRMLTLQLRELEEAGLVHRQVYAEVPPRVEYSLTEIGRTLEPVLVALKSWGEEYLLARRPD